MNSKSSSNKAQLQNFIDERIDNLLPMIVERLNTVLELPHHSVVNQGEYKDREEERLFYYVGKGDCKVTVRDVTGKETFVRRLDEGDHFGEMQIIYDSPRTATVVSLNYNTYAVMSVPLFKRLV